MNRFVICLFMLIPLGSFAQNLKTFDDPGILFTAKYPANWVNKIKEGKRVFFTSPAENKADMFFENINVSVSTNPEFGTSVKIKDLIQDVVDKVKESFNSFKEESRTFFKWNGADAWEIIYSGRSKSDGKTEIRITQWLCFYKTRLYLLTYTALKSSDMHAAAAKQIMNSVKFRP